jgi:thiosulfate/3-mercaptopyruvate sulfurtransferase
MMPMTDVSPLVSTQWLAAHLDDATVRIVDIRSAVDGGARAAFEAAHVPGAVHTDYAKDGWRRTQGMASGLLPETATLARLIGQLDVTPAHHVVIVAAGTTVGDFSAAARVYWTFKCAGHRAVSILDGGMAAWNGEGRSLEAGAGKSPVTSAYPLDTRSTSYFEGREKSPQALRAGRLPGALHLDHSLAFDKAAQRLKPLAELRRLFAAVPAMPVMSYCNTGHQAATSWFVLSELLQRPSVTLYDGSMSEWTEDAAHAVETGP